MNGPQTAALGVLFGCHAQQNFAILDHALATRHTPGNTADSYEIYDVLCAPDGRIVAILECFTHSPTVYYSNTLTPTGEWRRLGAGSDYDTTRDWAERVTELKVDRDLNGRRRRLERRPG